MKSNNLHVRQIETEAVVSEKPDRWWWLAPVLWALLLFVASSIPGTSYPEVSFHYADKLVHVFVYGTLGGLLALAAAKTKPWTALRVWLFAVGVSTVYGGTDELHQLFVPNRSADLRDLLADTVGAAVGAVITLAIVRRKPNVRRV